MKKKTYMQPATHVVQLQNTDTLCAASIQISDTDAYEDACGKENNADEEDWSWGDIDF